MKRSKIFALPLAIGLVVAFLVIVSWIAAPQLAREVEPTSQSVPDQKILKVPFQNIEPIKVERILSKGKELTRGERFYSQDDWLNGLVLSYKNTSGKKILSVHLQFEFPETEKTGSIMAYTVAFGTPRASALLGDKSISFDTNSEMVFKVDPVEYARLVKFIEQRQPLKSLSEVQVSIGFILFDDLTGWNGEYVVRDPANPKRWVVVPGKEAKK